MKFKFLKKNLIVTYHPETIYPEKSLENLTVVLNSIKNIKNTGMIITAPNADAQGILMINYIKHFVKKNKLKNFLFIKSLGATTYLSLLKVVDGVVGNSSSGISEVPFFGIRTLNIGDRQHGRIMASSILNCPVSKTRITESISKILNEKFNKKIKKELRKYGNGQAADKISKKIFFFDFKKYQKKFFYDI